MILPPPDQKTILIGAGFAVRRAAREEFYREAHRPYYAAYRASHKAETHARYMTHREEVRAYNLAHRGLELSLWRRNA